MATKKPKKQEYDFKNVAVPTEVHKMLREIADAESRSMAKQLAVMIKKAHGHLPIPFPDNG